MIRFTKIEPIYVYNDEISQMKFKSHMI